MERLLVLQLPNKFKFLSIYYSKNVDELNNDYYCNILIMTRFCKNVCMITQQKLAKTNKFALY